MLSDNHTCERVKHNKSSMFLRAGWYLLLEGTPEVRSIMYRLPFFMKLHSNIFIQKGIPHPPIKEKEIPNLSTYIIKL